MIKTKNKKYNDKKCHHDWTSRASVLFWTKMFRKKEEVFPLQHIGWTLRSSTQIKQNISFTLPASAKNRSEYILMICCVSSKLFLVLCLAVMVVHSFSAVTLLAPPWIMSQVFLSVKGLLQTVYGLHHKGLSFQIISFPVVSLCPSVSLSQFAAVSWI